MTRKIGTPYIWKSRFKIGVEQLPRDQNDTSLPVKLSVCLDAM